MCLLTELVRLSKKISKMKQVSQFLKKRKVTLLPSSVPLISRIYPHLLLLYSLDIHKQVPKLVSSVVGQHYAFMSERRGGWVGEDTFSI